MTPQLLEEIADICLAYIRTMIHSDELAEFDSTVTLMKIGIRRDIEALLEEVHREALNTDKVTRVEVIDHTKDFEEGGGRAYVNWKDTNKVELSFQDDERTLKIFISNQQDKQE